MVFCRADDTNMTEGEAKDKRDLPSGGYGCPNGRKFTPNEIRLKIPFRWNGREVWRDGATKMPFRWNGGDAPKLERWRRPIGSTSL